MTKTYLVQKRAADVLLGDRFKDWAHKPDYTLPSRRVLNVLRHPHTTTIVMEGQYQVETIKTDPNMLVLVEVLA